MLGVSEELLRNYARRGTRPATAQAAASPREVARPARPDAATQAELGLVAIAIRYPPLRAEILSSTPLSAFDDSALAAFFEEICRSDETGAQIEIQLQEQLTEEQRARLGEFMVGEMLDDSQKARAVANDYLDALDRRRRAQEIDKLRRTAAVTSGGESDAAAQAIVTLRRQPQRTSEGTS
jgi:hypothetical protein